MILSKVTKRNIVLFISAFLLLGILHVGLYYVDFTHCISTVLGSALVVLWAIAVQKRIVDRRLRTIILCITGTLLFHFAMQLFRYDLVENDDITTLRYLWYLMFIPMTAQPVLCFLLALSIHRPGDRPLPRACGIIIAAGAVLVLGVLTNDLHFQAWSFPGGVMIDDGSERKGWLFYAVNAFIYGFYVLTMAVIFAKDRRYVARNRRWLAALPLLIGAVYFSLYSLGIAKRVFPCHIWNMGEMTAFCIIVTIEVCVQLGMIPANRGYEILFGSAALPAAITDNAGNLVYRTEGTVFPFVESDDVRVVSHSIQGGRVSYPVDLKGIRRLNRELAERVEQLETRNAYLAEETDVMRESAELQTRIQLYERITGIVKPQLDRIDEILNSPEGLTERQLARIAVLKAYIKRRSNMELLGFSGPVPVEELSTAVAESLEYVQLCGVNAASSLVGSQMYDSRMVSAAYEYLENVIEDNLDVLSDIIIAVRAAEKKLTVRIMLTTDGSPFRGGDFTLTEDGFTAEAAVSREETDIIAVLTCTEGGERQ